MPIRPCPLLASPALLVLLAACSAMPEVRLALDSDVREARQLLAETVALGPVLVQWWGDPPLAPPSLLAAVERGVPGMAVEATATGEAERRFVFDFTGGDAELCSPPPAVRAGAPRSRTRAAFCDGERALAVATAAPEGAPERLIWRLVGRLVPDDYPDTYGFNLFGGTFGIGGGIDLGF